MEKEAFLVLENGKVFKGKSFGAVGEVTAEVVFTTGMTGYLETLTDNSYYGQITVQTFPLIGNYGVIPSDFESCSIGPKAYIVKEWCQNPSNFRCESDIDTFLKSKGIVGLYDIDTRTLTKIIREKGVMNGMITDDPKKADITKIKEYRITNAVESVSTKKRRFEKSREGKYRVVLMDYGLKENIRRELCRLGCDVTVCPHNTNVEEIKSLNPDGIMLSNGPGDPEDNPLVIENLRKLCDTGIPIFGICLGHQLLALANGFKTNKLKYGHRGANQPVKDLETGRVYISSQNHGYAVVSETIDKNIAAEYFSNANDNTNEGIRYLNIPAFSVQFHPEACGGPNDTKWLFNKFIDMLEDKKNAEK